MQVNLDVSLLVDQFVEYTCARNEGGQYCGVAQFNAASDVCALLIVKSLSVDDNEYMHGCLFSPSVVCDCCLLLTEYNFRYLMCHHVRCRLPTL